MGEDGRACSSAAGIDSIEESKRQKRKRRGGRCDEAASKSRGKEVRAEAVETDSDEIPRCSKSRARWPFLDAYAAGYDVVANKIAREGMRAVGTVWGPERGLQCLGSAALFSKE